MDPDPGQLIVNIDSEGFLEVSRNGTLAYVEKGAHAQLGAVTDDVIQHLAQVEA